MNNSPTTFIVKLVDLQKIYSYCQPDSIQNIIYDLQHATIQIPGVNGSLKDGDKFVLYGSNARTIAQVYGSNLQVVDATITFSTTTLTAATQTINYSQQIVAAGISLLIFSATGLPSGLSISSSGLISGIPNIVGSNSVIVTATDNLGNTGIYNYTLTTSAFVSVSITTGSLASSTQGTPYSQQIAATGVRTLTFSATGLPSGLSISSSGLISGTPTVVGSFSPVVTVIDSIANSANHTYALTVVSSFIPTQISGIRQWIKSDTGLFQDTALTIPAVANNDPVGGWQDQSGQGSHLIQGNNSKRPLLIAAFQNGLPVIRTDGISQFLKGLFTLNQPCTIVGVFRYISGTLSNDIISGGNVDVELQYRINHVRIYAGAYSPDISAIDGNFGILTLVLNGASSKIRMTNGSYVTGDFGSSGLGGLTIGAYNNGNGNVSADFCEIIVYSNAVSDANLDLLQTYLNNRWTVYNSAISAQPVFSPLPQNDTWDYDKYYLTVIQFGSTDYRMWYACGDIVDPNNPILNIAYAISTDGITWTRPVLNQVSYGGNTNNNLLYNTGAYGGSVYYDSGALSGQKFVFMIDQQGGTGGLYLLGSNDGITWSLIKTIYTLVSPYKEGKCINKRADGRYAAFYTDGHGIDVRSVGMFVSDTTDATGSWTDHGHVITATLSTAQLYSLTIFQDAGTWWAPVSRYNSSTDIVDLDLYSSTDEGFTWTLRTTNWIPRGGPGNWDSTVDFGASIVRTNGVLHAWYTAGSQGHSIYPRNEQIGRKVVTLP